MSNHSHIQANPPARTHAEAAALFRRPFAPGAIGFRAMTKVPYNGQPYAGAQVAAYIGAQSVIQRLNAVVPGRWRQQFQSVPAEFAPAGSRRVYLACRLIVTLPVEEGGPDVEAVYEDVGEMDSGLARRGQGALLRRAQARRRRCRDRRLPVHLARGGRAADRPARPPGAGDPPPGQERPARALAGDRAVAAPRLPDPGEHRRCPPRPRRDPRPRRARERDRPGRGRRPGRPARPRARQPPSQPARRATGTARSSPSTSATSDRRPHDVPPTAHLRAGGHGRNRRGDPERGPARSPDPDPAAPPTALRRPAAPAPIALQLQPLRPLPRGLAPALHPRRAKTAPTGAMFLGRQVDDAITTLLPAHPRPPRATVTRPGQGHVLGRLETRSRDRARAARNRLGGRAAGGARVQARPRCDRRHLQPS